MKKILFVCLGNVGRSQMAEAFYNNFTKSKDAWSAGLQKHTPAKYGTPIKRIFDVMAEVGIDISGSKVKTVTENIVDNSGIIIIMAKENDCPDFLLKSGKNIFWYDIEDPEEMGYKETIKIRDRIKFKVKKFIT